MSCQYTEAAAEACYEKACEAAYAFFPEADWDTPTFDAWVNWRADELFAELPDAGELYGQGAREMFHVEQTWATTLPAFGQDQATKRSLDNFGAGAPVVVRR